MDNIDTRRVILAGAIGNVLEWYDFAVYGYFATAIGRAFFPKEDPVAQVLAAFGIFAVGFLMRPVGGALLGHIGDKFGRRTALTISVAAMAIPTFLVGVLPGYAVLGVAAPILLTVLRMIQGLSVGGEYTTSVVFMVEHAPPGRRGTIGAMACCGAIGGILLGSATGAILAQSMHNRRGSRPPGRPCSSRSRPTRRTSAHPTECGCSTFGCATLRRWWPSWKVRGLRSRWIPSSTRTACLRVSRIPRATRSSSGSRATESVQAVPATGAPASPVRCGGRSPRKVTGSALRPQAVAWGFFSFPDIVPG